jgi:hypothetical protein
MCDMLFNNAPVPSSAMKTLIIILGFIITTSFLNASGADTQNGYDVHFGIIGNDIAGKHIISKETNTIPYKMRDTGFRFGYQIVPHGNNSYVCEDIVRLPSTPRKITGDYGAIKPSKYEMAGGPFMEVMWLDPGDPAGDYSVEVFVNEKLIKTIKFSVINDQAVKP